MRPHLATILLLGVTFLSYLNSSAQETVAEMPVQPQFRFSGEAALEYSFFSNGEYGFPNTSDHMHESYRISEATIVSEMDLEAISVLGLIAFREDQYTFWPDPSSPADGSNSKSLTPHLERLEVFHQLDDKLSIGFGRILTTMGYESLLRKENQAYSFTIAAQAITPGYFEGVRISYLWADWLKMNLSSYNSMAESLNSDEYISTKSTEFSIGGHHGSFEWLTGYIWGTDGIEETLFDPATEEFKTRYNLWGSYSLGDSLKFLLSYEARTDQIKDAHMRWTDSKVAVFTWLGQKYSLSGRYEFVQNAMDIGYANTDVIESYLLTAKFEASANLTTFAEFRVDDADHDVFTSREGVLNNTDVANVITIGALIKF